MNAYQITVIEKTDATITLRRAEHGEMLASRYTVDAQKEIKDIRGRKISRNAVGLRDALLAAAREAGFQFA